VDGPVLKCLSFLGSDIPGVKGLPPLPPVKFSNHGGIVSKFGGSVMDRAAALAMLQAAGIDTTGFSETDPSDAVLQAIVAWVQAKNGNPPAVPPGNPADPGLQQMADAIAGLGTTSGTGSGTGTGLPTPQQLVMKFVNQQLGSIVSRANAVLGDVQTKAGAVNSALTTQLNAIRTDRINQFFDRMAKSGQVTIAMQPGIRKNLEKCDMGKVSKFSHNDKATGTELDEAMDFIATTYPVIRDFDKGGTGGGGRINQPAPTPPPTRNTGNGGRLTPERRQAILSGSPIGQSVLSKTAAGNN
jgi:hypothetical protein